jgi:predicted nucleotidyltransferase
MSNTVTKLINKKLITPPTWLASNVMYEVMTGSIAYGVSNDTSDCDIYGFCIPRKEDVFPNLKGLIPGFDEIQNFEQYSQHHILDKDTGKNYDISIYNIVKYFKLVTENNPNMVDTLYVPGNCVLYTNYVGNLVRQNRDLFLHKGSYYKFSGYAHSMLHKLHVKKDQKDSINEILNKLDRDYSVDEINVELQKRKAEKATILNNLSTTELKEYKNYLKSNRLQNIVKLDQKYDLKFGYHLVRLAYEADMILSEGTLDLQRHREHLKAIRRGEVSEQDLRNWFSEKEKTLEKLYRESTLRNTPDVPKIRQLLLDCLEHHYRTLENCFVNPNKEKQILEEIRKLVC